MAYWVVYETATGRLRSRGDSREPESLPAGLTAKSFSSRPLDTEEWDESKLDWRAMTIVPPVDITALVMADVDAHLTLGLLTTLQKRDLRDIINTHYGGYRFN